jgi:hypothetical protein
MDANAVGEIERRRDSFKADPLHYLKRHREIPHSKRSYFLPSAKEE